MAVKEYGFVFPEDRIKRNHIFEINLIDTIILFLGGFYLNPRNSF